MQKWERDILAKAINEYGDDSQLDMCIEEMSELTKEICKKKRGRNNMEEIAEEMVDVYIMLEQLRMICNIDSAVLELKKFRKLKRLKERLKDDE